MHVGHLRRAGFSQPSLMHIFVPVDDMFIETSNVKDLSSNFSVKKASNEQNAIIDFEV